MLPTVGDGGAMTLRRGQLLAGNDMPRFPLDDFIEAGIEGPDDPKVINAVMDEVNTIVKKYGGRCIECGRIGKNYEPFADLFEDTKHDQRLCQCQSVSKAKSWRRSSR